MRTRSRLWGGYFGEALLILDLFRRSTTTGVYPAGDFCLVVEMVVAVPGRARMIFLA